MASNELPAHLAKLFADLQSDPTLGEGASAAVGDETGKAAAEAALLQSFTGAEQVADKFPQYKEQIVSAATESFLSGSNWAYAAALLATVLGAVLVATRFPGKSGEAAMVVDYHKQDSLIGT